MKDIWQKLLQCYSSPAILGALMVKHQIFLISADNSTMLSNDTHFTNI